MAKRWKNFFAKRLRYRENSLIRPKQNGDKTQGFDTNPLDLELERRVTIHSKNDENIGDNQLIRGHKRFNDTVQMVDRDPFYSGYIRTQQETDNDSNVYTDNGRFPVMSLFAKNRLVTEDPEQIEGRESYSGVGVATQTFSGLGEKVMMSKANAGLLFSSLRGTNGWETSASLGNKNFYINMGASETDGMQLNARNITSSPYKVPVRSLPFGSRLLMMMLLENRTVDGNDEHNQAITDGTTYASRIYKLMRENSIPDSLLNIVPDVMPIYEVISSTGDKNLTELYDLCTSQYATQTLDELITRLNKLTYSTNALDSSKKRTCVYEYLRSLVFSVISRLETGMYKTLSELLPFDVYAAKNLNVSKYRRDYLMGYIDGYGDYSDCLYRTYPWEGVFTPTVNQQVFDIIEGWFAGSDGTSLQKLYEIIAPLGGELLNVYLDDLLKRHGHVSGLDTSVYDAMIIGQGYEERVTAFEEYDPTGKMASLLQDGRYVEAVRSVFEILEQFSGGSTVSYVGLLILVGFPLVGMISMYIQTSPRNLDLQLAGLDALIYPYANTSPSVQLSGNYITTNQFRFSIMANSLNWIGMGATNETLGLIRVITTGLCYVQDALDDGGLKIVGSQGVVTVSPSNPLSTVVNFKGLGEIKTNHLVAKTINCPEYLCGISSLLMNDKSNIVEVPVGGIVLANPHRQLSNITVRTTYDGNLYFIQSTEIEVNESELEDDWTWSGYLPFRIAQYNADENNWYPKYRNGKLLQKGTYRMMSLLPTDVLGTDEKEYSKGIVLMQKISDSVRSVKDSEKYSCNIPSDTLRVFGIRITLYPSSRFIKMLELGDGSLGYPRESYGYPKHGYIYIINFEGSGNEVNSVGSPFYTAIGRFAYSAVKFRKKSGSTVITGFSPYIQHTEVAFCEHRGGWRVDILEFGIYNPVNNKFLTLHNVLTDGHVYFEPIEVNETINDTEIHYMMAHIVNQEDLLSNRIDGGYVYKMTTNSLYLRLEEPVILYPKNPEGVIVLKEMDGILNVYYSDNYEELDWSFIFNGQSPSLPNEYLKMFYCVTDYSERNNFELSSETVTLKKVKYMTFADTLNLGSTNSTTMYEPCETDTSFIPYETEPSIIYPERIDPTTMTII